MRTLVIQNDSLGPAGLVGERILETGGVLEITAPAMGGALPSDAGSHDALLILGGPMSARDEASHPWLGPLQALVRDFAAADKPVLGLCLGAQVVARAFGGETPAMGWMEFGYAPLTPTKAAAGDPVLGPMISGVEPVHFMEAHEDTIVAPETATVLLTGDGVPVQAYRIGRAVYGFQCHIEATADTARTWSRIGVIQEAVPDSVTRVETDLPAHYETARERARALTDRWLALARAPTGRRSAA